MLFDFTVKFTWKELAPIVIAGGVVFVMVALVLSFIALCLATCVEANFTGVL